MTIERGYEMQDEQMTRDDEERRREKLRMEDEEVIWWVRYRLQPELLARSQAATDKGDAFFYARDEAEVRQKIAEWRHYAHYEQVVIDGMEQVSADFKLELLIGPLPQVPEGAVIRMSEA